MSALSGPEAKIGQIERLFLRVEFVLDPAEGTSHTGSLTVFSKVPFSPLFEFGMVGLARPRLGPRVGGDG